MRSDLGEAYFDWMCRLVYSRTNRVSYQKLLRHLYDTEFTYSIPMDGNRYEDGICLRYRFARAYKCDDGMVASYLDDRPCSVLEMMIALAIRCEENIMENDEVGNRTGQWFWNMIVNLGLGSMTDAHFDEDYFDDAIFRLLNREYSRNGEGGLFTVKNPKRDMRSVEIWYQMCWYLCEIDR